ncbi:hypothetical protein [Actinomycetospora aeridis]|uniref:Septum formation initiator n=1 Tax=Actinomycetospora aeridis TaxID=3129231 RepID=A0ABU8N9C6_9PSEU
MSSATLDEPRTGTSTRPGTRRDDSPRRPADRTSTRPAPATSTTTATTRTSTRTSTSTASDARSGGTAPFVLLIMVLLTGGLVATLWLSTAAAADSYRLDEARQVSRDLSEQTERLHRDVEAAQSAPALAAAARAQGMVPAGDPAVLLVAPDGTSQVIGDPRPAEDVAPPPAAPAPAPATPAQGTTGAQAAADGQPAPAPAGAAAAEDQLVAVPSTQDQTTQTAQDTQNTQDTPAGPATTSAGQ